MPVLTVRHHVTQALRFLAATNKYMAIGRTTAWSNESSPPAPSSSASTVEEVVCYAPLAQATLVKPDSGGSISHLGSNYTAVTEGNAYTESATRVYVKANFDYANAPLVTFRQIGLFTGLSGTGAGIRLPGAVSDPGILELLDNRTPTIRAADKVDVVAALITF
jgi:hypothetical protein